MLFTNEWNIKERVSLELLKTDGIKYTKINKKVNNTINKKLCNFKKKFLLILFNCIKKKLFFNSRNISLRKNKYISMGLILKSLSIFKKKEKRLNKNKKMLIRYAIKELKDLNINYLHYYTCLKLLGFNQSFYIIFRKSKFFKKIPINYVSICLNQNFYKFCGKKQRRIKRRIRKRIVKFESFKPNNSNFNKKESISDSTLKVKNKFSSKNKINSIFNKSWLK